jgi:general secretion pathway protein D
MKTIRLALALALTGLELWAQTPPGPAAPGAGKLPRFQSPPTALPGALPGKSEELIPAGTINWQGVELNQVLEIYAKYVGRTLLRGPLPDVKIVLKTETPLTPTEVIQALQAVLALNNVSLVNIGDKFVKVLQSDQAGTAGGEVDRSGSTNLPNLGSYITHIVQLKFVKPSEMIPAIQPFAKLPNSILAIDGNGILVLRDYAENVKRMLEMIEQIDVNVPAEYISEVIPIRYAKVDEIASALNSLGGGGGGATVSIGTPASSGQISGFGNRSSGLGGGMGGMGGMGGNNYQSGGIGGGINGGMGGGAFAGRSGLGVGGTAANPNGTPTGGSSFASRLNAIINNASGGGGANGKQEPIQLFGQTKIIPNESSSTLLIYATRPDMDAITNIIAKLDVPLAQVLVEAVIIDYSLGPNTFTFGVSAAQNPTTLTGNSQVAGGGNNGASFYNFASSTLGTNASSTLFGNSLGSGLSYFGNIGPTWDVAMTAVNADSHASVIQRPRIQTSQAKAAQFFVGDTVPYVTGNSYGSAYGNGVSYSQLSVGVELDVTPFINPDGLVVMDIQQEIDDLNGYTQIDNVGKVPNTIKRTLNAEIAVKDKDTVMLGGFIKSNKSTSRSGVPFLMDIPILGNLFTQRSDTKGREELIVLMRPTVLKTPELAAKNTFKEEMRLPGVSATAGENAAEENKLIDAQRKREQKEFKKTGQYGGFFVPVPDDEFTNSVPAAPLSEKDAQEKARAALAQKMSELDAATNAPAK